MGLAARNASGEIGGISERETLVRRDFCSTSGSARDADTESVEAAIKKTSQPENVED